MIRSLLLDLRKTPQPKPRLTEHQRDQACQLMLQYRLDVRIQFAQPAEQGNGDAPSVPADYFRKPTLLLTRSQSRAPLSATSRRAPQPLATVSSPRLPATLDRSPTHTARPSQRNP